MTRSGAVEGTGGRVVVVGSMNEDTVLVLDAPFDRGATRLVREMLIHSGGKGLNQAVAVAEQGAPSLLAGCVGQDASGERIVADASRAGVDVNAVRYHAEAPTGRAFVVVEPDGSSTIAVFSGANVLVAPEHVPEIGEGDLLVTQLELPIATVRVALEAARAAGAMSLLSLAPIVPGAADLIALAEIVVCNRGEAAEVLGGDGDAAELAASLLARGASGVVVTLGASGAVVADAAGVRLIPAVEARAVRDTTGAGDAFVGAVAAALVTGHDLEAAARLGVLAGARAVEEYGANRS